MEQSSPHLTVCIVARDEEANLSRLLPCIGPWADHIIVLDTGSQDGTVGLARSFGAEVRAAEWRNDFAAARREVVSYAGDGWVFLLDADELPTDALREEIRQRVSDPGGCNGFDMPRLNYLMGRPLRYGSQYPDRQLKLFRPAMTTIGPPRVHPTVTVQGRVGHLSADLEHFPYRTVTEYLRKFDNYTTWGAEEMRERGVRVSLFNSVRWLALRPALRFVRRFIFKGGFLNGIPGVFACVFDAVACMVQYMKLWQMEQKNQNGFPPARE